MARVTTIFERIESLINTGGQCEVTSLLLNLTLDGKISTDSFNIQNTFINKIIKEIDEIGAAIRNDETILISVKHQKQLRTCFQIIASLGILPSLLPGLGISLSKRCSSSSSLSQIPMSDEQKYEQLVICTDFLTRSYLIPVFKNIIITFHLSDYLAALVQLSFAPLKKPGIYNNFTMTEKLHSKLSLERQKYIKIYNSLVANCFQPILMKELLVLQSVSDPQPPAFAKRIISKEMSRRLVAPGGLLSLVRCFIESYGIESGFEWRKIDMICKIVAAKHGSVSEEEYLQNICNQLSQILALNNTHYLATSVACVLNLHLTYPKSKVVDMLMDKIFRALDYNLLLQKSNMPGTIVLSAQEIEHKVKVIHGCVCATRIDWPKALVIPNLHLLFLIGISCTKNEELQIKVKDVLCNCLEQLNANEVSALTKLFLFGNVNMSSLDLIVEEYEAGVFIKCVKKTENNYPKPNALIYFIKLLKSSVKSEFIEMVFEILLNLLKDLTVKRSNKSKGNILLSSEDELDLLNNDDENFAHMLQLLSEISTLPKVVSALQAKPVIILNFIESFLMHNSKTINEECFTIALVLLNTILQHSIKDKDVNQRLNLLLPVLSKMSGNETGYNKILCKEAILLISSGKVQQVESRCENAITEVFDNLLPVRAHGIMELTKLIDSKDAETISKRHYIFCIFLEQLKDEDSYIYLSCINGIASLCTHCTEDVLHILCKEYLEISNQEFYTKKEDNQKAEMRMKIGDVIVKVTKRLGEIVAVHKSILLNTMFCACRDEDPLIRTSALSNLAEIALILNYKIGSIIYEMLLCVWSIIETDKAIECRRAAVMVISSLLKGLGKETLIELKDNLLPIYRTLKNLYRDDNEDTIVRLHAQIALEELNDIVNQFLFPQVNIKQSYVMEST